MSDFYFHRPWWLLALLPLWGFIWLLRKRHHVDSDWREHIDAHLLPHLTISLHSKQNKSLLLPYALAWSLAIVVLSGPSWQKTPPLTIKSNTPPLLLVLDLSRSMLTRDIYPDRLYVAKAKLRQLLQQLSPRPMSLIVYSAMAHQVVPITEDLGLIENTLEYLQPELMPAQGSNGLAVLKRLQSILQENSAYSAQIVWISDGFKQHGEVIEKALQQFLENHVQIIVYGLGTSNGAYIPEPQRGYLQVQGKPVHSKLQRSELRALALKTQGEYVEFTPNDQDVFDMANLLSQFDSIHLKQIKKHKNTQVWQDQAVWLLLLLLPWVWCLFQPGLHTSLLPILISLLLFSEATMVYAEPYSQQPPKRLENVPGNFPTDLYWAGQDWYWQNRKQRALTALENNRFQNAEQLFQDPLWLGIIQYRQQNYVQALHYFSQLKSAEGLYNRANTLVRLGRYQAALNDYRAVLKHQPEFKPAQHNLTQLSNALKKAAENHKDLQTGKISKPPAEKVAQKKVRKANIRSVEMTQMAENLLDKPTQRDLRIKKDQRNLGLEELGSQSGAAMLVHDSDNEKNNQGGSIGQGMDEGSQELQKQDQLARKGQRGSRSASEHRAKKIVENKFAVQENQTALQNQEKNDQPSIEKKIQQTGMTDSPSNFTQQQQTETANTNQPKSVAKGGSGANAQLSQLREQKQFLQHWLNSIEDNPSQLLKEIFKREYQQRHKNNSTWVAEQELAPW